MYTLTCYCSYAACHQKLLNRCHTHLLLPHCCVAVGPRANLQGINDKRLRAYVAMQSAYGMEYLHLHYMVHFDLKCDNLLCDLRDLNKPVVKIGDLGLSKTKKGSFISGNMRGTLPWWVGGSAASIIYATTTVC